ncbi:MAG: hypothetical protein HY319_02560 [Armatimonadetes bacterium]|nr:hypothetical protein [Armatimonadota bacterium]
MKAVLVAPPAVHATRWVDFPPLAHRTTLSLDLLIAFWEAEAQRPESPLAALALEIMGRLSRTPELRGPIADRSVMDHHQDLLDRMMVVAFPAGLKVLAFSGASRPGVFEFFYATERFRRELIEADSSLRGEVLSGTDWTLVRELFMYTRVAKQFYNLHFAFEKSVALVVPDPETQLRRYFQLRVQFDFAELRCDDLPELTAEMRRELAENPTDLQLWREYLPLERFELYGFWVCEANEVTEELTLSLLKQALVTSAPLLNSSHFLEQQERLRELLRLPDLSLAVLGYHEGGVFLLTPGESGELRQLMRDFRCCSSESFLDCETRRQLEQGRHLSFPDLSLVQAPAPLVQEYREKGFRSILLAPLRHTEFLGALVLASGQPDRLNDLVFLRIDEALPLFSLALGRTTDSLEHRIQSVIKEKFTAIHPAVEWRFRKGAISCVQAGSLGAEVEDIVFEHVYPLYGVSDIRSSSTLRTKAIQQDLSDQLELARQVIEAARRQKSLSYLASREHRLRTFRRSLEPGLHSGDEARLIDFFRAELGPLFESLENFGPEVRSSVARYRESLDPQLGLLYRKRKAFEESVSQIRERITRILYEEQQEAQAILPHYFQMYKTDGVDHTIYAGASMIPHGGFEDIYLKNLRLWQLMTMCRVARETRDLEPRLSMPLGTAHLILVQDAPLSIRFSQDEKQFNVDGAYNARYEIIKKRLDKAEVESTGERLTQPGKLAIVYSHDREAREYMEYLDFLVDDGAIEPTIEQLELAPLPGVSGLRALRVTVV